MSSQGSTPPNPPNSPFSPPTSHTPTQTPAPSLQATAPVPPGQGYYATGSYNPNYVPPNVHGVQGAAAPTGQGSVAPTPARAGAYLHTYQGSHGAFFNLTPGRPMPPQSPQVMAEYFQVQPQQGGGYTPIIAPPEGRTSAARLVANARGSEPFEHQEPSINAFNPFGANLGHFQNVLRGLNAQPVYGDTPETAFNIGVPLHLAQYAGAIPTYKASNFTATLDAYGAGEPGDVVFNDPRGFTLRDLNNAALLSDPRYERQSYAMINRQFNEVMDSFTSEEFRDREDYFSRAAAIPQEFRDIVRNAKLPRSTSTEEFTRRAMGAIRDELEPKFARVRHTFASLPANYQESGRLGLQETSPQAIALSRGYTAAMLQLSEENIETDARFPLEATSSVLDTTRFINDISTQGYDYRRTMHSVMNPLDHAGLTQDGPLLVHPGANRELSTLTAADTQAIERASVGFTNLFATEAERAAGDPEYKTPVPFMGLPFEINSPGGGGGGGAGGGGRGSGGGGGGLIPPGGGGDGGGGGERDMALFAQVMAAAGASVNDFAIMLRRSAEQLDNFNTALAASGGGGGGGGTGGGGDGTGVGPSGMVPYGPTGMSPYVAPDMNPFDDPDRELTKEEKAERQRIADEQKARSEVARRGFRLFDRQMDDGGILGMIAGGARGLLGLGDLRQGDATSAKIGFFGGQAIFGVGKALYDQSIVGAKAAITGTNNLGSSVSDFLPNMVGFRRGFEGLRILEGFGKAAAAMELPALQTEALMGMEATDVSTYSKKLSGLTGLGFTPAQAVQMMQQAASAQGGAMSNFADLQRLVGHATVNGYDPNAYLGNLAQQRSFGFTTAPALEFNIARARLGLSGSAAQQMQGQLFGAFLPMTQQNIGVERGRFYSQIIGMGEGNIAQGQAVFGRGQAVAGSAIQRLNAPFAGLADSLLMASALSEAGGDFEQAQAILEREQAAGGAGLQSRMMRLGVGSRVAKQALRAGGFTVRDVGDVQRSEAIEGVGGDTPYFGDRYGGGVNAKGDAMRLSREIAKTEMNRMDIIGRDRNVKLFTEMQEQTRRLEEFQTGERLINALGTESLPALTTSVMQLTTEFDNLATALRTSVLKQMRDLSASMQNNGVGFTTAYHSATFGVLNTFLNIFGL